MSSQAITDKGLVSLTNKLLQHLHVYQEVKCVPDITAEIFVIIFEGLYGENLPELHSRPVTKEDNIHNCQVVIDALATKVLNTSLSHITGESIVNGNRTAINNLLEIFTDLFEFLTEKIEAVEDVVDDGLEDFIQDKAFLADWIQQKHIEDNKEKLSSPGATSGYTRFAWQDSTTVAEKEDDRKIFEPDILNRTMTLGSYHVPDVTEPVPSVPGQTPDILDQPTYPPKKVKKSVKIQSKEKQDFVPLFLPTSNPPEYITKVHSSCQTVPFYDEPLKDKNYQEDLNGPRKIIGSDTKPSLFPTNIRRNSDSSTQTEKAFYPESNDILEQYRPGRSTNQLLDMIESALKQLQIESQPTCYDKIPQKQVHFEDVYKPKEKCFHQNPIVSRDWKKNKQLQFLKKNYSEDLAQFSEDVKLTLKSEKTAANMKEYQNPSRTSVKHQRPLMRRSVPSHQCHKRKPVASTSRKTEISGEDLLPTLLDDLPLLHLSTETWHELWRKNIVQLEHLTKSYYEKHRKRDSTRQQVKEAEKRREILHDIMKKELSHMQRLKEIKESKKRRIEVRNRLHEKRIISAKARRYYDDFSVRMRSRMMNRKTKEELLFKNMFKDSLQMQKARVLELQKYVGELRKQKTEALQNDIKSMENYYCDQFGMLAEAMKKQLAEKQMMHNEHIKLKSNMKKELRSKMEKDIHTIQKQLCDDDDHIHFRQLDTDRLKQELQMANYVFKSRPHQYVE
ncbi:centrosomal protein of 95 kDa-like isoform X2 [Octopus sinensis]|uniref:Centrosomal protein of 95 kDa-like isoform X2 n=1 Tax=Octopus sinensis TaxID=2607531 RepID=A0A6P7SX42_9MOLL|nr:centrosomal protein of 95 kDa-like isoform X2 [Octopus sinensis]